VITDLARIRSPAQQAKVKSVAPGRHGRAAQARRLDVDVTQKVQQDAVDRLGFLFDE
jgi:hypothetical protein